MYMFYFVLLCFLDVSTVSTNSNRGLTELHTYYRNYVIFGTSSNAELQCLLTSRIDYDKTGTIAYDDVIPPLGEHKLDQPQQYDYELEEDLPLYVQLLTWLDRLQFYVFGFILSFAMLASIWIIFSDSINTIIVMPYFDPMQQFDYPSYMHSCPVCHSIVPDYDTVVGCLLAMMILFVIFVDKIA